jgi:hypothetical protein
MNRLEVFEQAGALHTEGEPDTRRGLLDNGVQNRLRPYHLMVKAYSGGFGVLA